MAKLPPVPESYVEPMRDRAAEPDDLAGLTDQKPSVELTGEVFAEEDVEPGIVNLNPLANAMADAQGVPVGSWDWMLGGVAPFSGSSGSHSSYGWSHTHKLTPGYIRAVLANYGHRRTYYANAPYRQFGYRAGGRPHGWEPESPGDQPGGGVTYLTAGGDIQLTGPEPEHLWLTPLFALIDDPNPILVETGLGNKLPSNMVAKWLATLLVSSAVGMVRDHRTKDGNPYPWTYGDRATGRLLHTIVEGFKRGCLRNHELPTAARYLADIVLPFYEKAPGIHSFGAWRDGRFPLGLFNGLGWIIPACYDAAQLLRKSKATGWADRFDALVGRWSRWMVDLNEALPNECFGADIVYLDPAFAQQESPPDSITPYVRAEDFHFSWDYKPWTFRAIDIAATVTGHAPLAAARDAIAREYSSPGNRSWMVEADGSYV